MFRQSCQVNRRFKFRALFLSLSALFAGAFGDAQAQERGAKELQFNNGIHALTNQIDTPRLQVDGTAQVNVHGQETSLNVIGELSLGGTSILTVSELARATAQQTQVSQSATMTVESGARLETPLNVTTGTMRIQSGGVVSIRDKSSPTELGTLTSQGKGNADEKTRIEVTGNQSVLEAAAFAHSAGVLDLRVSNGAALVVGGSASGGAAAMQINDLGSQDANQTVDIDVTGRGSRLQSEGIVLGNLVSMALADGGVLDLRGAMVVFGPIVVNNRIAELVIGGRSEALAPGFVKTPNVQVGIELRDDPNSLATGSRLIFNHDDISGNYVFTTAVTGMGFVEHRAGHTVMDGSKSQQSGPFPNLLMHGGTLELLGQSRGSAIRQAGGLLKVSDLTFGAYVMRGGQLQALGKVSGNSFGVSGSSIINVAGRDSSLTVATGLNLSNVQTKLNISNGAGVSAVSTSVDQGAGISLSSGAQLSTRLLLSQGSLDVSSGAVARFANGLQMGANQVPDALSKITVKDAGSRIEVGEFSVFSSLADLSVSNGAQFIASGRTGTADAAMQINQGSTSRPVSISVAGAGSLLQSRGIVLGAASTLVVSTGAQLELSDALRLNAADAAVFIGGKDSAQAPGSVTSAGEAAGIVMAPPAPAGGVAEIPGPRLVFNHTDITGNYVFTPAVTGAGRVEHKSGTTILDGSASVTPREMLSQVMVEGGTLITRNTDLLAAVEVAKPAALVFGGGRLGSTVVNGGRLELPAAQATQVTGDLTLAPQSTLLLSLHKSNHDVDTARLAVSGKAVIDQAGLTVQVSPGVQVNRAFTLLRAGTLSPGKFASLATTVPLEFLEPRLSYVNNTVQFELASVQRFDEVANGANAAAAGSVLEMLPENSAIRDHVQYLPKGSGDSALQSLSGDSSTAVDAALQVGAVTNVTTIPLKHLRASLARSGLGIVRHGGDEPQRGSRPLWVDVGHTWQRESGSSAVPGLRARTGGVYLGGDQPVGDAWRVGGALGFSHTHVDALRRSARSKIDNYSAGIYGGRHWSAGPGQINLMLGSAYTWHAIRTERNLHVAMLDERPRSRYHANTTQLFAELAYGVPVAELFDLEPYVGLSWDDLRIRGFNEQGAPKGGLSGSPQRYRSYATTLGLRTGFGGEVASLPLRFSVDVAWRRKGGDLTPRGEMRFSESGSRSFKVQGVAQDKNMLLMGATLQMAVTRRGSVGLSYTGALGKDRQREHSIGLEGRWAF